MGNSGSGAIIKPADCVLGLGIPTTRAGFLADLGRSNAEFASRFGFWGRYRQEVAGPLARRVRQLTVLGVTVVSGLTLDGFGGLFRRSFKVVVLFAHWQGNWVEFRDGFAKPEAVVGRIPETDRTILDLCVCHPDELVEAMRRQRPGSVVRYTHAPSTPTLWLAFYLLLMTHLHHRDLTYLEALEKTIEDLRREQP